MMRRYNKVIADIKLRPTDTGLLLRGESVYITVAYYRILVSY